MESTNLNTLKSEQFLYTKLPHATTEMESLTQNKISAKLIGVLNTSKNLSCASCKKASFKSIGKIATCPSYKMMKYLPVNLSDF